jgi:hypothetical protein
MPFPEPLQGGYTARLNMRKTKHAYADQLKSFTHLSALLQHAYAAGVWVNVGPLEYHGDHQCAPTLEQIIGLAEEIGFTILLPSAGLLLEDGSSSISGTCSATAKQEDATVASCGNKWKVHELPYFERSGALRNFQIQEAALFVAIKKEST